MMDWFYDDDEIFDFSGQPTNHEHETHEALGDGDEVIDDSNLKVVYVSSMRKEGAFRMRGLLVGQHVIARFDTGATHNFFDSHWVAKIGISTQDFEGLRVQVADGYTLRCNKMIFELPMK